MSFFHLKNFLRLVILPSFNMQRQQINIQNSHDEDIVTEPVESVQVTIEQEEVIKEIKEIVVRRP